MFALTANMKTLILRSCLSLLLADHDSGYTGDYSHSGNDSQYGHLTLQDFDFVFSCKNE